MPRFRYKHISSTVDGRTPSNLLTGEIAVNRFAGNEKLFIENTSGDVATFSSDESYTREKLGDYFIDENSAKTVTDVMIEKELVTAEALLDLDKRKANVKDNIWNKGTGDNSAYLVGSDTKTASGRYSVAEGYNTNTTGEYSHAEGYATSATSSSSHAEGNSTIASGYYSHAEGFYTKAASYYSHAEGEYASATSEASHAECRRTLASGDYSHAEGSGTTASGIASHAEGSGATANGTAAHAEGTGTASGEGSHAEGRGTQATGMASHAEGYGAKASGYYGSHAEGWGVQATGQASHAEGRWTKAYGSFSHTEGEDTTATSRSSHAEGLATKASGEDSHAEGSNCIASGDSSHAEGANTTAKTYAEHASGWYNVSRNVSNTFGNSGNTLFTVGNGYIDMSTYTYYTHNALEIRQNGDIYVANTDSTANPNYYFKPMVRLQNYLLPPLWEAGSGTNSVVMKNSSGTASGNFAVAEGSNTTASGNFGSHAEGYFTEANGQSSHAEGLMTEANGMYSHAEGLGSKASGTQAHAEGSSTIASGTSSHAEGDSTLASGMDSHAEGYKTSATTTASHAEGYETLADGYYSHAEGYGTKALGGGYDHVEGWYTVANNTSEHASGQFNISNRDSSDFGSTGNTLFSVGNGSNDNNRHDAIDIRQNGDIYIANTSGTGAYYEKPMIKLQDALNVDLSNYYTKSETSSKTEIDTALSVFADAVTYNSTTHYVEFYNGTTAGTKVFEYDASPFLIDGMVESVVITSITSGASEVQVLEITWNSAASSQVTDIPLSDIFDPSLYYTKSETSSKTEIEEAILWEAGSGNNSAVLKGSNSTASGNFAVAEGQQSLALGNSTHVEGLTTTAVTSYAHAEGWSTLANGEASHAEGITTKAIGSYSHAEGNLTNAVGHNSHAEGTSTSAMSYSSHAEGYSTIASGSSIGGNSHAEGYGTSALTDYTHTEGYHTIAYNQSEHASGKYNVSNTGSTLAEMTLFSVGNGNTYRRHNAFEIRQNGDIYCSDGTNDVKLQDTINNTAANTTALGGFSLVQITQSDYDALQTKDPHTLYIIVD